MESLRRNEVKYIPGVLGLEKVIVLSAADYEKLAEDISPEYPFLKDNRTLMTAQPGGTFHCLLVTAETEQEGMLFALTENTLYTGRAQNVPGMELQGIPVERITLEKPKAYQEHAVFFHKARGLDDITGRDVHRPMPERQTSFRVELAVVLSDTQFRQFKECGLMKTSCFCLRTAAGCGSIPANSAGTACSSKGRAAGMEFSWRRKGMPTPGTRPMCRTAAGCV